jgi:hypothetical protein
VAHGRHGRTREVNRPRPALATLIVLMLCGVAIVVAVASGALKPSFLWLVLIVLGWSAMCVNKLRAENDPAFVAEFAKQIAGDEPLELHCRIDDGGLGVNSVVVATDRRLILARPGRRGQPAELRWSVPYSDITSFVTKPISEDPNVTLLLQAESHRYKTAIRPDDARALSEIVVQRRPEDAGPLAIRLNDTKFKELRRKVSRSAKQNSAARDH